LIDWEMRRCPWYHDFTYFIVSSLDVGDRRRWEKALLHHYLSALKSHGGNPPNLDHAFYCYRREVIHGLITFISNGDGTQYWSEFDNTPVTMRFGIAAEDLDTFGAIEGNGQAIN